MRPKKAHIRTNGNCKLIVLMRLVNSSKKLFYFSIYTIAGAAKPEAHVAEYFQHAVD